MASLPHSPRMSLLLTTSSAGSDMALSVMRGSSVFHFRDKIKALLSFTLRPSGLNGMIVVRLTDLP